MINITDSMIYRLGNLNKESSRISYQMSSGKKLDRGSDDSVTYSRELYVNDKIRLYSGLESQIQKTEAQNNVADTTMSQIKDALNSVRTEVLKALNAGMDISDKKAVAVNISGIRERIWNLTNESVDGEYLLSGSDTTVKPFVKDANFATNGKITFAGDGILRKVAVDVGIYRDRGISGYDAIMYNSNSAVTGLALSFTDSERIIDEQGLEWTLDATGAGATKLQQRNIDGSLTGTELNISSYTASTGTYTTANITGSGRVLSAKHNFFDDLQGIVVALNTGDDVTLRSGLDKIDAAYNQANIGHAELGGRSKIFEVSLEGVQTKLTHFNILYQEVAGSDPSKLALESKALELTYTALYSTIAKMNDLSLVNFVR